MPGTRDFFRLAVVAARRTGHEPASHGARARSLGCSASRNPARHLTPIGGFGGFGYRGFATGARDDVDDANDELNAVFGVTVGCDSRSEREDAESPPNGTEGGPETSPNASPSHSVGQRISTNSLSHVDASGAASMVDVGGKAETTRTARASATVRLGARAFELVRQNRIAKGDVLTVAKIAGINAAKQTHALIPLCHQLLLRDVRVDLSLDAARHAVRVETRATCDGKTGVEMEALVAASVAGLTVYDMCKAASKDIVVSDVRLESKTGGKSGDYRRAA